MAIHGHEFSLWTDTCRIILYANLLEVSTFLAKGENPAWAGRQNGNDPDVLSSQLLDWYLEESTHSSRYFIGYYVLDNFVKVV